MSWTSRRGLDHDTANGVSLACLACRNIGETVLIENTHQKVKDLVTAARHKQISRAAKYQAVINAGVMQGRGIPCLTVSDEQKAAASTSKHGMKNIRKATHPNSHAMQKKFQDVMKYKASSPGFTWPSSSHISLFLAASC